MSSKKVHTYAASFGEDLARELIEEYTSEKETVLDPFMGAGIGIFQSYLLNRNAIGIDVDPISCLIVKTMSHKYKNDDIDKLDDDIKQKLNKLEQDLSLLKFEENNYIPGSEFNINGLNCIVPDNDKIQYWFETVQRVILSVLVEIANEIKDVKLRDIVRLAISSAIIRKWPNTLSLARDIDHSRPHRTERKDLSVVEQLVIFRKVWKSLVTTIKRNSLADESDRTSSISVIEGDACQEIDNLEKESVDYVLTSPPYFNAIDYPRAHRYSQWWLWPEKEPLTRKVYIGLKTGGKSKENSFEKECKNIVPDKIENLKWLKEFDVNKYTSLCRYIFDLNEIVKKLKEVLRPDKHMSFILANNKINGRQIPLSEIVEELLNINDFNSIEIKERIIEVNRRRYPYGLTGFEGLLESEYMINAKRI
jgi:hypothetical protein